MRNDTNINWLKDKFLELEALSLRVLGKQSARRVVLAELLAYRLAHSADANAVAAVLEALADTYAASDKHSLARVDALLAQAITLRLSMLSAPANFRVGRLLHRRSLVKRRLNLLQEALQLAEEALIVYGRTRPLCYERLPLTRMLIELHQSNGSCQRAQELTEQLQALSAPVLWRSRRLCY